MDNARLGVSLGGKANGIKKKADTVLLVLFYLLPMAAMWKQAAFSAIAAVSLVLILYFAPTEYFSSLYPLLFFFYEYLVAPGDIVVYRVYTVIFILRFVYLSFGSRPRFDIPRLIVVFLMLCVLFIGATGNHIGVVGTAIDLAFMFCFFSSFGDGEAARKRYSVFFVTFVFAAMIASVVGFFINDAWSLLLSGDVGSRYRATLEDPNYLCFYLNVAIAAVLLHPFFKKLLIKLPCLGVLYFAMFASASVTGILCNAVTVVFCFICLLLLRRIDMVKLGALLAIALIVLQLFIMAPKQEWGVFSDTVIRLNDKLQSAFDGDMSAFTTNRTTIWRKNIQVFWNQPLSQKLFGGNFISAMGVDKEIFIFASHQELLDVLLSTGAVGAAVFIFCSVFIIFGDIRRFREQREIACIRLATKLVWLVYGCALTMLLNTRFYILFFL